MGGFFFWEGGRGGLVGWSEGVGWVVVVGSWDGVGWDGMGWHGMGWAGWLVGGFVGWDGMGRHGMAEIRVGLAESEKITGCKGDWGVWVVCIVGGREEGREGGVVGGREIWKGGDGGERGCGR